MVQERPLEEGSVHNSISNRPPSAAFHYFDAANARLYLCLVFLTYFPGDTPIYCGATSFSTNAYFLGKDVLKVEKCTIFWGQGNLMNRLIHRSWGEGFSNIFLDLSANFSLLSSAFAYRS